MRTTVDQGTGPTDKDRGYGQCRLPTVVGTHPNTKPCTKQECVESHHRTFGVQYSAISVKFFSYLFLSICFAPGLTGCSAERVTSGPSQLREQEVLRLRAVRSGQAPVVFGQVLVRDETGRYPLPKALVSVDGKAYYTNETGAYHLVLAPGTHQFIIEQTGIRSARTTLTIPCRSSLTCGRMRGR